MHFKYILGLLLTMSLFSIESIAQNQEADAAAKRHNEMMEIISAKPKYPVKNIGIYLYDGYNTLDAFGPFQTLSQLPAVNIFFVSKEKGFIKNQRGVKLEVNKSIDDVTQLDILVIPGGSIETFNQTQDAAVLNWIKKIDSNSIYTTSVCTGAWILGATGLLKDKAATTNWYRAEEMMKMYGAKFKQERYVNDGKYWTSAGVTAGIDMSLAIINELMGKKYTQAVMLDLEYNPQPPVQGGTPASSEPIVADMMKEMYDMALLPLIEKEKQKREGAKKPSVFAVWPALDEYHKVMSKTFHPAEEGNLNPLKSNAADLAAKATLLKQSVIPADFKKEGIKQSVSLLEKESAALAKLVKNKKPDEELKKAINALHDRFHEIVGLCRE